MRAAFREGLGCVILAPDQTFDDIAGLPQLEVAPPPGDAARTPWPDGDLVTKSPLPNGVSATALQAASDWTFNRPSPSRSLSACSWLARAGSSMSGMRPVST